LAELIAQSFVRPNSSSLCFYTDDFRESIFIRKNNLARPEYVFWAKPNSAQPSPIGPLRNPNPRASSINRGAHLEIFHSHPSLFPGRHFLLPLSSSTSRRRPPTATAASVGAPGSPAEAPWPPSSLPWSGVPSSGAPKHLPALNLSNSASLQQASSAPPPCAQLISFAQRPPSSLFSLELTCRERCPFFSRVLGALLPARPLLHC
jgi:hypothetical protein